MRLRRKWTHTKKRCTIWTINGKIFSKNITQYSLISIKTKRNEFSFLIWILTVSYNFCLKLISNNTRIIRLCLDSWYSKNLLKNPFCLSMVVRIHHFWRKFKNHLCLMIVLKKRKKKIIVRLWFNLLPTISWRREIWIFWWIILWTLTSEDWPKKILSMGKYRRRTHWLILRFYSLNQRTENTFWRRFLTE